jgi:succinyl-CoA synthetase beta subunit
MITVCIEIDDQGQVMVGQEPAEQPQAQPGPVEAQAQQLMGGEEEQSTMKPVASVDEALAVAKQLLSQGQQSPDAGMAEGFGQPQPTSQMRSA